MGKLTELFFKLPTQLENITAAPSATTTLDSSFFNLMENFEQDITETPAMCKLHIPTWLNLWFILVSITVLTVLIVLGVLVRYIQIQRQRLTRSELIHVSSDFYSQHYLDRSQIMVY